MDWDLTEPSLYTGTLNSDVDVLTDKIRKSRSQSTRVGVAELLTAYKAKQLKQLLQQRYHCGYQTENEIPDHIRKIDADALNNIRLEVSKRVASIIKSDGQIANYIDFNRSEIKQLSISLAECDFEPIEQIKRAEALLGTSIPGTTVESQYARTRSVQFWRRALTVRVTQAREQFFLRLGMLGKQRELYASDFGVDARDSQMRVQEKWMRDTVLVSASLHDSKCKPVNHKEIRLADIAKGPKERFAKIYSFVKAMDLLSIEQNLSAAMLTITLEPEWHPNPWNGTENWNGKSPREAHKTFCERWQAVQRDLHRIGIRLSGLRVAEPHRDACPHYHIWLLYRPEHETKILLAIMDYFPLKLKVRSPTAEKPYAEDVIYETREDFAARVCRPCLGRRDGAQVEFSKIDREKSKAASYVTKYLMETLLTKNDDNSEDMLPNSSGNDEDNNSPEKTNETPKQDNKPSKSKHAPRVNAFRSIWGIKRGQLFGVAKCLTAWDELRRMNYAPENAVLRNLWSIARGGVAEGRIGKGSGQRGDARAFLEALGGLDAARNSKPNSKRLILARLVEEGANKYGDAIKKTVGIVLLLKEKRKVKRVDRKNRPSGFVWRTFAEVLASVQTKVEKWKFETRKLNLVGRPSTKVP
jgi:hypothetical protein